MTALWPEDCIYGEGGEIMADARCTPEPCPVCSNPWCAGGDESLQEEANAGIYRP